MELTIDELARETGMTVRNIRSHASRGLLPPPEVRGRTGYYGPEHVARLQLVTGLQQQGFNLAAIRSLVSGPSAPNSGSVSGTGTRGIVPSARACSALVPRQRS